MKNKKKAQFFLIASLIIIAVLSSFFLYQNRLKTYKNFDKILSLKDQIEEETSTVIDYGVSNNEEKLKDFLGKLSSDLLSSDPEMEIVFFFGNGSKINVLNLADSPINFVMAGVNTEVQNVPKSARIGIGGGGVSFKIKLDDPEIKNHIKTFSYSPGEKITFKTNETSYEIPLEKYKNFYFMIKKSRGEDKYVAIK